MGSAYDKFRKKLDELIEKNQTGEAGETKSSNDSVSGNSAQEVAQSAAKKQKNVSSYDEALKKLYAKAVANGDYSVDNSAGAVAERASSKMQDVKFRQQAAEEERLLDFDVSSAEEELLRLQEQRAGTGTQYSGNTAQIVAGALAHKPLEDVNAKEKAELEDRINALVKEINLAKRAQNKAQLHSLAVNAADFEKYSQTAVPEEEVRIRPHQQNIQREDSAKKYMSGEQQAIYNYYYNKFGKEKAEEYIDSIRDELNAAQAQAVYQGNEGNFVADFVQLGQAGFEQAKSGFQGTARAILGDDSYQAVTASEYLSQMAMEDLADDGKLPSWVTDITGWESFGQVAGDLIKTTTNMIPSVAVGLATGGAGGALAVGASSGGNSYNEAIREGFSADQARNYAVLTGASEALLSYLLSGVGALGGKVTDKLLAGRLAKVDGALKKVAKVLPAKMLSEGTEEYLQEILDPVFRNIVFSEDNEVDLFPRRRFLPLSLED